MRSNHRQKTMSAVTDGASAVDLRPVEGAAADADLGTLAKALGHPTRVRIIRILRAGGGMGCMALVEALSLAQSTVSEHLRLLREAGIVTVDADAGRTYHADIHRLRRLKALVGSL
jgi:ArsR family transcriptional regulator